MLRETSKPPLTRRRFGNVWGELAYLCEKVRYWLYARNQRARAGRYRDRLERVLEELPENDTAIIRQEGWALLHELRGETAASIAHREREIVLIKRLHKHAESARCDDDTRAYILRDRGVAHLRERQAILEALKTRSVSQYGAAIHAETGVKPRKSHDRHRSARS
jgi:hypothetical protein